MLVLVAVKIIEKRGDLCADWRFEDLGKWIVKLVNFMMWVSGCRRAPFPKLVTLVNHAVIFWREQPQLDVGFDRELSK